MPAKSVTATEEDALEVIRYQAADVLSLYPGKHSGIRQTQQIAKMAEAAGVVCTIGSNLEREVATAAMAHVTVCTANIVTAARLGVRETPSAPGTTVIVAVPVLVLSVTEVAVNVTVAGLGALTGPV